MNHHSLSAFIWSVADLLRHPRLNHRPQVAGGVDEEACGELLRAFFEARRAVRG